MDEMPLGVMTWVLGDPFKAARLAEDVGVKTMQLGCPSEDFYTRDNIREFKKFLEDSSVRVTAVFCGFAGEDYSSMGAIVETVGFRNPKLRDERVRKAFQISDFAKDLGVHVIAAHIGFVPEDTSDPLYDGIEKAVQRISDHCKKNGQYFALETGQEPARTLLQFIEDIGRDNVGVNFDPANMLFYGSGDPIEALEILKGYVIGVHCKDFRLPKEGEEVTFQNFVLFGEGDVGAERFIRKLEEIGYRGPLTIEREIEDPEQQKRDMIENRKTLEKLRRKILSSD